MRVARQRPFQPSGGSLKGMLCLESSLRKHDGGRDESNTSHTTTMKTKLLLALSFLPIIASADAIDDAAAAIPAAADLATGITAVMGLAGVFVLVKVGKRLLGKS